MPKPKPKIGLAAVAPERRRQIAAKGGAAPHSTRTHWQRGKRRNPVESWIDWKLVIRNLREIGRMRRGSELARLMGVNRATVLRWRRGVDIPPPSQQAKLLKIFAQWKLPLF